MRPVSEEERKWFMEAMESQQEDLVKRMKNIKVALDEKDDADEQVLQVLHRHNLCIAAPSSEGRPLRTISCCSALTLEHARWLGGRTACWTCRKNTV